MIKEEMIAMLLAGGQESRLGVLTGGIAKPALPFGARYRIIDFPLSNCINSGIDTVGVLTQYRPLRLSAHIGTGMPWDLDRCVGGGGVTLLPTYEKNGRDIGTAGAVRQNLEYLESCHPEYVLILSGDQVYKMDYGLMLKNHKEKNADVSIAVMPTASGEPVRRRAVTADKNGRITGLAGNPEHPCKALVSMGIYLFRAEILKQALLELEDAPGCDFEEQVIPRCLDRGQTVCAYEFQGYWRDVGTPEAYWDANMELVSLIPEFNLYEEYWKIYTKGDILPPQYLSDTARVTESIIGEGAQIYGEVRHSVIGAGVTVGEGAVVKDSVVMRGTVIGEGAQITKAILAEEVRVGSGVILGDGEYAESALDPQVYRSELAIVGEGSVIPNNVVIGKNTAVSGVTAPEDYPDGRLCGGGFLIREGGRR